MARGTPVDAGAAHGLSAGQDGSSANLVLVTSLVALAVAQLLKVAVKFLDTGRVESEWALRSGGMPSSHSAMVCCCAATVGFVEGAASPLFAVATVFALCVCYDACGVRLHAGRHARVLNALVADLAPTHAASRAAKDPPGSSHAASAVADTGTLREHLGHTPSQVVAGIATGVAVAAAGYIFSQDG